MNFTRNIQKPIVLVLISSVLLSLPWLSVLSPLALVGLVPILILWHNGNRHFLLWLLLCFFLWIAMSCWWVVIATPVALVGVPLFCLLYSWGPFAIWYKLQKNVTEPVRWILLVSLYISAEGLYTYAEFSFPWVTFGNAFARTPFLVQWYEWTGVFGGSLWVLLSNILCFKFIVSKKCKIALLVDILIPIICSSVLYYSYEDTTGENKRFSVIQPNINPYTEKFNNLSVDKQLQIVLDETKKNKGSDFYVAPETALDGYLLTNKLSSYSYISDIRHTLSDVAPSSIMIIGASTITNAKPSEMHDFETQHQGNYHYKVYNTALWVDTTKTVDFYHKGCLVVGAEKLPYPKFFAVLQKFISVELGGVVGNYGRSRQRDVYDDVGTAICYESVYGEFFTEYIKAGAKYMTVITNDGWWNDTPGYKQHMSYSRLRAIETRRSIARSANTGISCFINGRGDVLSKLGWDKRGTITENLYANDYQTFYVRMGDWIVRISFYLSVIMILYTIAYNYRKNSHLI